MLGYPFMANKSSKWSASNRLVVFCASPCSHRKPVEREHYQVYGAIGGPIAQVRVVFFPPRLLLSTDKTQYSTGVIKTDIKKSNSLPGISSHPLFSKQSVVFPVHPHSPTASCTHTFSPAVVSQSPFLTFYSISHLHNLSSSSQLLTYFLYLYFFIPPREGMSFHVYPPLFCNRFYIKQYSFRSISLYLPAPQGSKIAEDTGQLWCAGSPGLPDVYTTGLWCADQSTVDTIRLFMLPYGD